MATQSNDPADQAASLLETAQRVTVLTGAGVSAESGVPTFRGEDGLWHGRRPEEVATPQAFLENPEDVWEFYFWRRENLASIQPNPAHHTLASWETRFPSFQLITQNVDGLHAAAGSRNVIRLHGSIWRVRCTSCRREAERREPLDRPIPYCPDCGEALRPAIVWFGEPLELESLEASMMHTRECDLFLSIGTSALVQPAASLPVMALESGATVIEINPEPTPLSGLATVCLRGPAGQVLPDLEARIS